MYREALPPDLIGPDPLWMDTDNTIRKVLPFVVETAKWCARTTCRVNPCKMEKEGITVILYWVYYVAKNMLLRLGV